MGFFTRWLSGLFGSEATEKIESEIGGGRDPDMLALKMLAIQTAVGYIAAAVGQCDFRTFQKSEEFKGKEHFLWNYSPNPNQNSTQFLQDWAEVLLYNNEALIVEENGSLYVADMFGVVESGTQKDVYTGITVRGKALKNRSADDVLYFRLNNDDVQPLLAETCGQYEELIKAAIESYEKSSADKGILSINSVARGKLGDNYEKIKADLLNRRFRDFFGKKSSVLPLYDGFTYTPHTRNVRNVSELNDVKSMADEIYNRVGQAFRIPPAMLRGETANAADVTENFIKFGVCPLCNMLQEEITRKRYGEQAWMKGNYLMVDPSNVEIGGVFDAAAKIDKLISCGVFSIDEIRGKIGEPLLGTPEAQTHYITKNYAEMQEVGKEDGEGSK